MKHLKTTSLAPTSHHALLAALAAVASLHSACGAEPQAAGSVSQAPTPRASAESLVRFTQAALAERGSREGSSAQPHLGAEVCLHAEIVPTAASARTLDLALDVEAKCDPGASTFSVALEVVRDDGSIVTTPSYSTAARRDAASWATTTPSLDDGFYAVKFSALRLPTGRVGESTFAADSMFLRVARGAVTVLSIEEYHAMSQANAGRVL